nr:uncharacterized protein LOC115140584 isoform X2 [Oncorhynchus nerka]
MICEPYKLGAPPSGSIDFLCAERKWVWGCLSSESSDLRLPLVSWAAMVWVQHATGAADGTAGGAVRPECGVQQDILYLTALVAVMTLSQDPSPSPTLDGPVLLECVELLLVALAGNRRGYRVPLPDPVGCQPATLPKTSLFSRWCSLLEVHLAPKAPEALRIAWGLSGWDPLTEHGPEGPHSSPCLQHQDESRPGEQEGRGACT